MTSQALRCLILSLWCTILRVSNTLTAPTSLRRRNRVWVSKHSAVGDESLLLSRKQALLTGSSFLCALSSNKAMAENMQCGNAKTKTIGWGIIGLGDVTVAKSGPAFYKAQHSKLVAVMRRTPGAAQAWVKEYTPKNMTVKGYDNVDQFLADPDLNAVYISTPPGAHLEVAIKVAAAGKPAYIEKPVGRCAWETQAIRKAFEDRGLPLYTAYISRAYERTEAIVELLKKGTVGDCITSITYKLQGSEMARGLDWNNGLPWRLNATLSGGGLIMDVGCHVLDRIDFLAGPIVDVEGTASRNGTAECAVEDFVHLNAKIGSCSWSFLPSEGATLECTWDFASQDKSLDELVISGPKGSLKMAAMSPSLPIYVLGSDGVVQSSVEFEAPAHTAQRLIQAVTNDLLELEPGAALSRGDNAVRTSRVLDQALSSYYGGRSDEFWLRPTTWPGARAKS